MESIPQESVKEQGISEISFKSALFRHIMLYTHGIVGLHGGVRVVERGEGVGADIPNLRGIFLHALQNVQQMLPVQFQEAAVYDDPREVLAVDADGIPR